MAFLSMEVRRKVYKWCLNVLEIDRVGFDFLCFKCYYKCCDIFVAKRPDDVTT